ncbi:MAG TPA: NAD(P)/FAD-dependent oxidoreductase [Dehalococcoidia bacterium]|nr:NAD(P)/FAD-dependent oxidoreductase [Dehalococcoidia bacterium]
MAGGQRAIGVIGGGALGLGAALRLAEAGRRVVVIEREAELGGLAAGFRPGADSAATLEKFYHHIFRTDRTIIRMIQQLGLGDRLEWKQPVTASLRNGRVYPMSLGGILRFDAIPIADRLRFGLMLAALKLTPGERPFAGKTAAGWSRRVAGPRAYAALIEPILEGKFGGRANEIAMGWLWSRFHERSLALGYLRGGFQQLYDALGERVRALSGEIVLDTAATRICSHDGGVQVETNAGAYAFERLIVTAPQRVFERMAEGLPESWARRYPGPDFYDAQVLILALDRRLSDSYWISVGDPGYPFLVLVEHTNFMPAADYGGRHLVYLGNYLPPEHPLLREDEAGLFEEFLPAIRRLNPSFDPAWVRQRWLFHAPFAQPIVTGGYLRRLPPLRTPLPGVYLATMAHVYPQDRGQNYSLALGRRAAELLLHDAG